MRASITVQCAHRDQRSARVRGTRETERDSFFSRDRHTSARVCVCSVRTIDCACVDEKMPAAHESLVRITRTGRASANDSSQCRAVRFQESAGATVASRTKKHVSSALLFLRVSMNLHVCHLPNEHAKSGAYHLPARVKRASKGIAGWRRVSFPNTQKVPGARALDAVFLRGARARTAWLPSVSGSPGPNTPSVGIFSMSSEPPARASRWLSERGIRRAGPERGHHQPRRRSFDVDG